MVSDSSKTLSYAAYIPLAGWIVAIVARHVTEDFSPFTTFHLRQGFGLLLLEVVCYVLFAKIIGLFWLWNLVLIPLFLAILTGIRGVYASKMRYQPLLGRFYENIFTFIGDKF